jgi:hypothetical protein
MPPRPSPRLPAQRRLSVTLKQAYGDDAFSLVPLTFSLPAELPAWRAWLSAEAAAGRDPGPWMLKTAQHLGATSSQGGGGCRGHIGRAAAAAAAARREEGRGGK